MNTVIEQFGIFKDKTIMKSNPLLPSVIKIVIYQLVNIFVDKTIDMVYVDADTYNSMIILSWYISSGAFNIKII